MRCSYGVVSGGMVVVVVVLVVDVVVVVLVVDVVVDVVVVDAWTTSVPYVLSEVTMNEALVLYPLTVR